MSKAWVCDSAPGVSLAAGSVDRYYRDFWGHGLFGTSMIGKSIHGVLLIEISESASSSSRSQQCNLEENPFSLRNNPFQHLLH
jgi:hypothetical protein